MRMTRTRMTIVALCFVLSCSGYAGQIVLDRPQDVGMSPEKLAQVSPAVQDLVDAEKIAGASVVVARRGKVVFFETFGVMDKEAGKPVAEDTIFRFYSMTKPVTSVAVMMLVEQGKIKLDDPVSKYIEPFKNLKVYDESGTPVEATREVTVRDLLRHTSGLTYGYFGNTAVDKMYRNRGVLDREASLQDMAAKLGEIPLLYQPGTKWHYGVSTDVLGYLVEKVSGESLDAFFRNRIFGPLGMKDTGFHVPPEKVDRFAVCYSPMPGQGLTISDDPRKSQFLQKPGLLSGGGGLVSTIGDYLQFCRVLANKGELDGKRLLRTETVEMMTRNQLPESVSWMGQGFGLGFSVWLTENKYGAGEYGWGGAASTHFWIHPKHELIVIALSQLMPYSNQLADAVRPLVYEAIVE
ncbi:MAG: beta-lactamase family protein [Sedimentisphaerales bacterium]|nr:beta-lactamase family protein [Sedimentisphaerales bacterium]